MVRFGLAGRWWRRAISAAQWVRPGRNPGRPKQKYGPKQPSPHRRIPRYGYASVRFVPVVSDTDFGEQRNGQIGDAAHQLWQFFADAVEFAVGHFEHKLIMHLQEQSGFEFFIDRKSTRLNSSHVRISYAVFCLKK